MHPDKKELWITALRSGEYRQGQSALHTKRYVGAEVVTTFCCLGVLCDVARKNGLDLRVEGLDSVFGDVKYGENTAFLPVEVVGWAGLQASNPHFFEESGEYRSLAGLNDQGATFSQIADIIEERF